MKVLGIMIMCCSLAFTGCESNSETSPAATETKSNTNEELNRLKADNQKLRELLTDYENVIKKLTEQSDTLVKQKEDNPDVGLFTSVRQWKKITLRSGESRVELTEPALLEAISSLFIFYGPGRDYPSGPHSDIDPFVVEMTDDQGTYTMEVVERDTAAFPAHSQQYFTVNSDIACLGKAFLPKPEYVPVESLESRMLNSGMVVVKDGRSTMYIPSAFRVHRAAKAFLASKKRKIAKPKAVPANLIEQFTFYLYGEQIQMKMYDKYISIEDPKAKAWYEVGSDDRMQIHGAISAG